MFSRILHNVFYSGNVMGTLCKVPIAKVRGHMVQGQGRDVVGQSQKHIFPSKCYPVPLEHVNKIPYIRLIILGGGLTLTSSCFIHMY